MKHDYFSPPPIDRIIILKNNLTEEEAFKHEIYMIAVLGRKDLGTGMLRNRTDGGDQPPTFRGHTQESKQKIRNAHKGRVLRPEWTEEQRKRKSDLCKKNGVMPPINTKEYTFLSPEGKIVSGLNIAKFAKEYGLSVDALYSLRAGKQNTHKGWKLCATP